MNWRRALERGEVSELVVVIFVAVVLVVGLVVDGGAKMTAASQASSIAQQAARAGAQPLDALPDNGAPAVLDSSAAAAAAREYLADAGATGSVHVTGTDTIEVTVTTSEPTVFLGMIGIQSVTATRTASVHLIHGQEEVIP